MYRLPFKIFLCLSLVLLLASCELLPWSRSEPLAKVGSKTLYGSDLNGVFQKSMSPSDSMIMLRSYVDTWVKRELLLHMAEANLDSRQKDVAALLEEYRSSLLVYRYEQEYIKLRLDTVVSDSEVEQFYNANRQNFTLTKPLVRILFIKLKRNSPYLDRIKTLYRSSSPDEISTLESLCLQAALRFDYFGDRWLSLDDLMRELPPVKSLEEQVQRKYVEVNDNTYAYLVAIRDFKGRDAVAPLDSERDNIKTIILSRRKQRMIEDLEKRVLRDAKHSQTVKIFLDE